MQTINNKPQLKIGNVFVDRVVREDERLFITSISRSHAWYLEQQGLFPKRIKLGSRSVGWRLSELQSWLANKHDSQQ